MTEFEFVELLKREIIREGSQWKLALRLKIPQSTISKVARGEARPVPALYRRLGYERHVTYLPITEKG